MKELLRRTSHENLRKAKILFIKKFDQEIRNVYGYRPISVY